MTITPGTRFGRYEVRSLLGAGGMGEVYLAWDQDLERKVAIKVLRDGGGEGGDRMRRFVQEAKASSGLHHPNIAHVYEIGSHDDLRFIAMELVEGETLRARLRRGLMSINDILEIGTQIAAALGAAHKAGIVHRDIKPENVIITPEGYAKVLDFGLAKLREIRGDEAATLLKTEPGIAMGTFGYMPPEQLMGGPIAPAADVYALGVVLYEMLAGRRPVDGAPPLDELRPEVPPRLALVIGKALAKRADERYPDAGEVQEELRAISRSGTAAPSKPARNTRALPIAITLIVVAVIAGGAWTMIRSNRKRDAMRKIDVAEALLKKRDLAGAYELAVAASPVLPDNDRLRDVISRSSAPLTIESDPPGATVYLQRYKGPPQRVRMGITPLTIPRLVRAEYLLTLEKSGYATGTRPISSAPVYALGAALHFAIPPVRIRLAEVGRVPPGMVFVEGGPYRLSGFSRPSDRIVELRDFFIDRYEVSNADFAEFIRAGGYRRRELWKERFADGATTLTFEQAMGRFRDSTGLPGPRSWSSGAPPPGREKHPVTDVSWYEASAFAEWKGKRLPTIHQWERAARPTGTLAPVSMFPWGLNNEGMDATERANFLGKGTMPVDTMPFGAGPSGAYHMAGNVSEWCRNPFPPGYAARGGGWNDAIYTFGQTAAYPAFYSSPTRGFRCISGGGNDEGNFTLNPSGFIPVFKPVDDATFAEFRRRYDYKREPLNARVVERVEAPDWTREKIVYTVAGKSVPAYLYLPRGFRRPYQVIHYLPPSDVTGGLRTLPEHVEAQLSPDIRAGRAVFSVEMEGFLGRPRPPGWVLPDAGQEEAVDYNVSRLTELRRGLDYLESRNDLDRTRFGLYGLSAGGGSGVFAAALESRYRSAVFAGTGLLKHEERYAPAANRINFVPRIRIATLMLHGRYDEVSPLQAATEPMFHLLPGPKRLEIYEGGHAPPAAVRVATIMKWFDETMGPVEP